MKFSTHKKTAIDLLRMYMEKNLQDERSWLAHQEKVNAGWCLDCQFEHWHEAADQDLHQLVVEVDERMLIAHIWLG